MNYSKFIKSKILHFYRFGWVHCPLELVFIGCLVFATVVPALSQSATSQPFNLGNLPGKTTWQTSAQKSCRNCEYKPLTAIFKLRKALLTVQVGKTQQHFIVIARERRDGLIFIKTTSGDEFAFGGGGVAWLSDGHSETLFYK